MSQKQETESKGRQKKQQKKAEKDNMLQKEILQYIAKNEEIAKTQEESVKEIQKLKEENNEYIEKVKSLPVEEVFDEIIKQLNSAIQLESQLKEDENKIEVIGHDTQNYYQNAQTINIQYTELDKYNKDILKKIKLIQEDKDKLIKMEEEKTNDIKKQCEEFKAEALKKYNETSNDVIKKDNEDLKKKLEECQNATVKIRENIDAQNDLKKKSGFNIDDLLNLQIGDKGKENNYKEENEKLQKDLENIEEKFNKLNNEIKTKTKKFENQKKSYEKIVRDYMSISKENKELKSIDCISLKEDIKKNDEILNDLVQKNKELQNQLKCLKELKEVKSKEPIVKEEPKELTNKMQNPESKIKNEEVNDNQPNPKPNEDNTNLQNNSNNINETSEKTVDIKEQQPIISQNNNEEINKDAIENNTQVKIDSNKNQEINNENKTEL